MSTKCMEIVNAMAQEDQDAILDRLEHYQSIGVPAEKAQKMAASDIMAEIQGERADFMKAVEEQHPEPVAKPTKASSTDGKSSVLSKNGIFNHWPKFNTWTRAEYNDVVSLLPKEYRDDPHRQEPIPTQDWDAHASASLPEIKALNDLIGDGTYRLDDLGNIIADGRKNDAATFIADVIEIADKHGLGVFLTGVRTTSIERLQEAGFVSEFGIGGVLQRVAKTTTAPMPMASSVYNNTAYGTMMSYKPRGFAKPMFSARDQTETPEFKQWFGDSKVVDADGKPLVVYHGTDGVFHEFKRTPYSHLGHHFGSANQANKRISAKDRVATSSEGPVVMPVYLSIKNPLLSRDAGDWSNPYSAWSALNKATKGALEDFDAEMLGSKSKIDRQKWLQKIQDKIEALGYDGVLYKNRIEGAGESWIAFDSGQIKSSIGNNGDFDGTDPDIRHSTRKEISVGADAIEDMSEDERDNLEPAKAPGGWYAYVLYEARKIMPKPSDKLKKLTERNSFIAHQDNEYLANVDGKYYGVNKWEDPDATGREEEGKEPFVYAFNSLEDGGLKTINTMESDVGELMAAIRKHQQTLQLSARYPENSASFKKSLAPLKSAIYSALLDATNGGPFDGGCVMFAESLQSVIGGDVVVLTRKSDGTADHAAVMLDGRLIDFDGPLNPRQFISRFERNENVEIAGYRPMRDGDLTDAKAGVHKEIVSLLRAAFSSLHGQQSPKQSAQDQTETPEFKKWFGDSKVVDADGKPLMVYHGTGDDFSVFDKSQVGRVFKRPLAGPGFYFTPDRKIASTYAENHKTPFVMAAYLSVKNPLIVDYDKTPMMSDDFKKALENGGYDGVIIIEKGRIDQVVAFKPEQIKSAIGNDGNFDPNSKDISRSVRDGTSTWDMYDESKFDNIVYKMQNKMIDAKRVIESITKYTGAVANDLNVYLQEELFHGRAAKRTHDFASDELEPLMKEIKAAGYEIKDVEEFLHARHAREANQVIADRNPGDPGMADGGSGMTNQAADDYLQNLPARDMRKLGDIATKVDAITAKTRQLYADYGLESQDTVDSWASMFQHYIPLMREDKDGNGGMGIGQGFSVKGKETRGRTGSKRKVVDVLANIAMQRERLVVRGEKNRVSNALVGLASANPNPEFWSVGTPPTERVYDPKTNTVVERADPMYKSRENVLVAKVKLPSGEVKEVAVVFNEDNARAVRMAQALKNLDSGSLEGLLGVSAKITRYFSAINTQYNPVFGVVNLIRDIQAAMINLDTTDLSRKKGKIARDTVSALAGIYSDMRAVRRGQHPASQWSQLWEDFQNEGGQTGYRQMFATSADRADELMKTLNPDAWLEGKYSKIFTANGALKVPLSQAKKGADALFEWLSDYNESMENGVRLAAYKAGLDQGMSKPEAASLAKNLTVNFNRKGQVGQQAGAVYAFFNAAMQGTARIGQTLFTMEGGDVKSMRLSSTGKKVVYGGMLLGSMQALALAAAGFGDDDPPEFLRERSLIIPTGGKTYVSIPMPMGFNVLPGLGRNLTEFALSGFNKPAKRAVSIIGMFADNFNPIGNAGLSMQTITPTALDPLVALTENRDFTGKPIARTNSNKAIPGFTQYKDSATTMGKLVAEAINGVTGGNAYVAGVLSPTPDQIDYLVGQITGGVGREASKVEQTLLNTYRGEEVPLYKVPLAGRFIGNAASNASQSGSFYGNVNRLNELETEVKGLRKDGKYQEAQELLRARPDAYLIAQANVAERQLQRIKREKRALIENGADRAQIKAKEDQATEVMARLNRAAEKIRETVD